MEITGKKLPLIREALKYGLLYSKSEAETAEFGFLLLDVERSIAEQKTTTEIEAIAQKIYDDAFQSGKGTDYFYSPDYEKMAKDFAIRKARELYKGQILVDIIYYINHI